MLIGCTLRAVSGIRSSRSLPPGLVCNVFNPRHTLPQRYRFQHRSTNEAKKGPFDDAHKAAPLPSNPLEIRESPWTLPNALTTTRLLACPVLGYMIVQGQYDWATGILAVSGFTDWLDGFIARRWQQRSVLGSILDPAADKALMTTLVCTLAWTGMLPVWLAAIILGRDVALSMSAFYLRYTSLPHPRTLPRYFNPSIPSAEVIPTQISKVNTAVQLLLMGVTTIAPLLPVDLAIPLKALQVLVAGTTIWSGLSYVGKGGFNIVKQPNVK